MMALSFEKTASDAETIAKRAEDLSARAAAVMKRLIGGKDFHASAGIASGSSVAPSTASGSAFDNVAVPMAGSVEPQSHVAVTDKAHEQTFLHLDNLDEALSQLAAAAGLDGAKTPAPQPSESSPS